MGSRRLLPPAAAGLALSLPALSWAATFTVTNLDDDGAGSLRDAVAQANAAEGADTVVFDDGLGGSIVLSSGEIAITDALNIQGPGAAVLTIDADGGSRIFAVSVPGDPFEVVISGLRLTGGSASGGGAIRVDDADLVLRDCELSGNTSPGWAGALYFIAPRLLIEDCELSDNSAGTSAGAAYIGANEATLRRVVMERNQANSSAGAAYLDAEGGVAEFAIEDSRISGNSAGTYGGGLYLRFPAHVAIRGTEISDNQSVQNGGGIESYLLRRPHHRGQPHHRQQYAGFGRRSLPCRWRTDHSPLADFGQHGAVGGRRRAYW
jgi:hypothetical protein